MRGPPFLYSARSTGPIRERAGRGCWRATGGKSGSWSREEWDIATDDGIYRLVHADEDWFLDGIYA